MPKSLNTEAAIQLIQDERERQISKGYSPNKDDELLPHQLPAAASCHLLCARTGGRGHDQAALMWPLDSSQFKPAGTRLRSFTVAAAFLLAAIERELRIDERNRVHHG